MCVLLNVTVYLERILYEDENVDHVGFGATARDGGF